MRIVADENIPGVEAMVGSWAEVQLIPGREIAPDHVATADALLVRSVTRVDQQLLEAAGPARDRRLKFVGSATIGCDHVDVNYLKRAGIAFVNAPGCNANAVVDYVMSALMQCFTDKELESTTIGIVGMGNVGSRLAACCRALALDYRAYDPLIRQDFQGAVSSLQEVLRCQAISLHVPLSHTGKNATYHMLSMADLELLPSRALLVNSCRGEVVDNHALLQLLERRDDLRLALDVWENEPEVNSRLLAKVDFATPHIAGYSSAGKVRGAQVVVEALFDFFRIPEAVLAPALDTISWPQKLANNQANKFDHYRNLLAKHYNLREDSQRFVNQVNSTNDIAAAFDAYRKHYALRSEIDYSSLL